MIKNIKYFDNDIQHGINYDWNLIKKEFDKLGIPDNVVNPFLTHKLECGKWVVDMSERSIGKTTNWLLLGMVMNKLYGTTTCYIRQRTDMIMPKHSASLFKTILEFDYISKITEGKYNFYKYKSRQWFYWNTETDEISIEPFMYSLSIEDNALNKSSFNAPRGDLCIYDEFISRYNYQNEFVDFCDTLKTIIRERDSALIVLLANTINQHHNYFNELGIYKEIQEMKINEKRTVITAGGTHVDIALLGTKLADMPIHRQKHNAKFFGFRNPLLNSIRGGDWAIKMYPHCPKVDSRCICRNRYIKTNGYFINLELHDSDELGLFVKCHIANKTYEDSIIYNMDLEIKSKNYRYKFGKSKMDKVLLDLLNQNKWFYASNLEGSLIDNYVQNAQRKRIFD